VKRSIEADRPEETPLPPSKSQRKRDALELFALGRELAAMSPAQLDGLPLDADLREALGQAREIRSNVARKRQLQFVAKMLRRRDVEALREALAAVTHEARAQVTRHHRVESWRDRLVAEGDAALTELFEGRDTSGLQALRQLLLQARREAARDKPPAAARKLFRLLMGMDGKQPLPPAKFR